MLPAYRATLERWIQGLLYPGLASLIGGTLGTSVLYEVTLTLGVFLLGITTGLLIAKALSYPHEPPEEERTPAC